MIAARLKEVDIKDECLIYGWIRDEERILKSDNIPCMIQSICVLFYAQFDRFDKVERGVELSNDKRSIENNGDNLPWGSESYGLVEIATQSELLCRWDLYIKKCGTFGVSVGVGDSNHYWIRYFYSSTGCKDVRDIRGGIALEYGMKYGEGDTISIKLDLNKKEISFRLNDVDQGIAYDIWKADDVKYRLSPFPNSISM